MTSLHVAVVGSGPAGLMAAQTIAQGGCQVVVYDSMKSPARKFLLAGRGGLNLTHSEPFDVFMQRYGNDWTYLEPAVRDFPPEAVRAWAEQLGCDTFTGSSGRVFPRVLKTSPLLRAWLRRLTALGISLKTRHRWEGWDRDGNLVFATADGLHRTATAATVLALGGASWPHLGSDGQWRNCLSELDIPVQPFAPANCGFDVELSAYFLQRHAGLPLKRVKLSFVCSSGQPYSRLGELMITATGFEGGLIYALGRPMRETLSATGQLSIQLDLVPERTPQELYDRLNIDRGKASWSKHLHRRLGLDRTRIGLLREVLQPGHRMDIDSIVAALKHLELHVISPRPVAEAISSAGGVMFLALNPDYMLTARPGTFCAGEMLDWEAPTGGYLLSACLATGRHAGLGVLKWLGRDQTPSAVS